MKFLRKKKPVRNDDDPWLFWEMEDDGGLPGLEFIVDGYSEQNAQRGYGHECTLAIHIPDTHLTGLRFPTPQANSDLSKLEDDLISLLEQNKVHCKQVYRSTYDGRRTLIFEIKHLEDFQICVSTWEAGLAPYRVSTEYGVPWGEFNKRQPDQYVRQQMGNRSLVELLIEKGSSPTAEHFIEHTFFGEHDDLLSLQDDLLEEGGQIINLDEDILEVGFSSLIDIHEINHMTYFMMDKAEEHNCTYDGWMTAIVKGK